MSDSQRTGDLTVLIDRNDVEALREQSLLTLEANHHYFEEIEAFGAEARQALARIYRDAFAVLDAVGWDAAERPARGAAESGGGAEGGAEGGAAAEGGVGAGGRGACVPVPLTRGHVEQLWQRRFELGHANIDRVEHTTGWTVADLEPNRQQAWALERVFGAYVARVAAR